MEKMITIRLTRNDIGQIIDGLTERMLIWKTTAEYLDMDYSHLGDIIEECSDPEEAAAIAEHYESIIAQIRKQL